MVGRAFHQQNYVVHYIAFLTIPIPYSAFVCCYSSLSCCKHFTDIVSAARCPKPQGDQYNMTVITRDDYNSGYNLTISCNQGYQPVGITQVMCSNESTWIPALPNCVLGRTGTFCMPEYLSMQFP